MIRTLEGYWADYGCVLMQPYHTEVAAGTMNPATALRSLGAKPWKVAYVEPVVRPTDGGYGENPYRCQHYLEYHEVMMAAPAVIVVVYFWSLAGFVIDAKEHGVRLVDDEWEQPTPGGSGLVAE